MTFRDRYFEALGLDQPGNGAEDQVRLFATLQRAHDIRKFEIDLYWKRAAYFWAFRAISFAALGLSIKDGEPRIGIALLGAAALGVLTGFTGWLTAKGSKFWQENWESHVEMLEGPAGEGRLTQVVIMRGSPPFSVSRLNQTLIGLVSVGWLAVLGIGACPWVKGLIKDTSTSHQAIGLLFVAVVAGLWLRLRNGTRLAGRAFTVGGSSWVPYPEMGGACWLLCPWRKKTREPRIIWRVRVGATPPSEESSS